MNMYFSGAGGVGIGPLAMLALDAGDTVFGSDAKPSSMTHELDQKGAVIAIGQDGSQIAAVHATNPIDWLVHSSSLPANHPELVFAREHNIKTSKRDEYINHLLDTQSLRMVAIAGTHGKTTTSGMVVWLFKQLGIPVSYSVGTTISFGAPAEYVPASEYFVYECDEFDRNFLQYHPHTSAIVSVDYDHPDTYPAQSDYIDAFRMFIQQSGYTLAWQEDATYLNEPASTTFSILDGATISKALTLPGAHTRANAWLAIQTVHRLFPSLTINELVVTMNSFPGTHRRFELLQPNVFSDYAHHPKEIAATLQMATEISPRVVAIYQPHQNIRQHQIIDDYKDCFAAAEKVFWLPTYLSREDPALPVLTPQEIINHIPQRDHIIPSEYSEELAEELKKLHHTGALLLFMGAGDIDAWARKYF